MWTYYTRDHSTKKPPSFVLFRAILFIGLVVRQGEVSHCLSYATV